VVSPSDVKAFFDQVAGDWHTMRLTYYDERVIDQLAWEKAELLAASAHSRSNADMNRRLRAYIIGAHPNTGTAHFEVDSDQIDDYDWNARP
jgi:hypothetical protein